MLDDDECERMSQGNMVSRCLKLSRLIKRVAIQENVDRILLISLADVIPFLPLMLPNRIKLSGIIYKIYLRAPKTGIRGVIDRFRYTVMAHNGSVDKVFILNDPRSAGALNKIYKTNRFTALADPVPAPDMEKVKNLRSELDVPASSVIFLHFGAMDTRKGTLEILKAINLLPSEKLYGKCFIFAGRVSNDIKEQFYTLVDDAKEKGAQIIVKDEFCSYELLFSLCYTSDCILIPYLLTDLSSGALGYAALFGKPVIGPKTGLIGELIEDNKLGIPIDTITPESIVNKINTFKVYNTRSSYAKDNSISAFCKTVLNDN